MKKNILMGNGEFNNYYSEKEYSYENNKSIKKFSIEKNQTEKYRRSSSDENEKKPDENCGNTLNIVLYKLLYNRGIYFY